MLRTACFAICVSLVSFGWTQNTGSDATDKNETGSDDTELALVEQVNQLVRQLNDGTVDERQTAENALVELGIGVLDELPKGDPSTVDLPQEVQSRLSRVRNRLEKQAATLATQATTITLSGEFKLSEVLVKIAEQTGNRVIDYRKQIGQTSTDSKINVDFRETPFWQAIDTVMSHNNLAVDPYSGGGRMLALVNAADGQRANNDRIAYGGLFRFDPQAIRAVRSLRNPNEDQLTLSVEIMWEPHVAPLGISHPIEKIVVVDEKGNTIGIKSELMSLESSVQSEVSSIEVDLPLELPSRDVRRITSVKGEMLALVPGRDATFKFENIEAARNVERNGTGVKVILERVRKNADVQQVRILVRFDEASGVLQTHRGWIYGNKAYLVSPEGKQIDMAGFETTRQQAYEVGLAYNFVATDITGYSFVYKSPAAIVPMPVAYELKDIDLP